jgi:uncharacterized membrane protein
MHRLLWALQIILGVYFIVVGAVHFILPARLPAMMAWMYDLSPTLHLVSGTAEILGGLGLILPAATGIQVRLTPLAAVGLAVVMLLAVVFHLQRGEVTNVPGNVLFGALLAFVAYGRLKLRPLEA